MEALDRTAHDSRRIPGPAGHEVRGLLRAELSNAVNATAEGYAFPTNLDRDQPIGSLAPPSQVDTVLAALAGDLSPEELDTILDQQHERRIP